MSLGLWTWPGSASSRGTRALALLTLAAALADCGGGTGSPTSAPEQSATLAPTPSASASPSLAPAPTPTPAHGTFKVTGAPVDDIYTAVLLQDGRVLEFTDDSSVAQLYDPSTGTFSLTRQMTTERGGVTATLLGDGDVLVVGGGDPSRPEVGAELYDPAGATFRPAAPVVTPRVLHTATLLKDGRVLIAGGVGPRSGEDYLASAEIYDPVTGQFSAAGSLPSPRVYNTATLLPRLVLIAGGWSASSSTSQVFSECYLYDPANQRSEHTATLLLDGRVLVVGGGGGSADIYDPATGRFSPTGSLMTGYGTNTATLLKDGRVLTANVGMLPLTAELYWP